MSGELHLENAAAEKFEKNQAIKASASRFTPSSGSFSNIVVAEMTVTI